MGKFIDLTGQKFGRLTVVSRAENYITPKGLKFAMWNCVCDCGNKTTVVSGDLRGGKTKSCGCYHDECCSKRRLKHGESSSKLYSIWKSMNQRCYNSNNKDYYNYGARGITVCNDWKNDFVAFSSWAKSNGYKEGLSIDRINSKNNYCPKNCRWVNSKIQANNTRRNRTITLGNEKHTIAEWSELKNINYHTLLRRINAGWEPEKALNTPVKDV